MRMRFLDLACCPECRARLDLAWATPGRDGVEEGALACADCGREYPVINGIPRLLPDALAAQTVGYHREFFNRHAGRFARFVDRAGASRRDGAWWGTERRTLEGYSYQWKKFKQMFPHWEQVFLDSIKPIDRSFFAGKVGLDGGCGFGRSIYYAAGYGAEMIGLDLSEAIEAARENTHHLPNVHLVQGDIFHPPVRHGSLDFAYSIGVLHHLPDPRAGFLSLAALLKPGAPFFIWVYLRGRGRQIKAFTAMRAISTRVPLRLLNVVCLALAASQYGAFIAPHKLLRAMGAPGLAERVPFSLYAKWPFRALHTDWFDGLSVPLVNYYKPHEIAAWFREGGLERVQIDSEADWNGRALGYAPAKRAVAVE